MAPRETRINYLDQAKAVDETFSKRAQGYSVALGREARGPWYVRVMDRKSADGGA
jgi:hypothetical protein